MGARGPARARSRAREFPAMFVIIDGDSEETVKTSLAEAQRANTTCLFCTFWTALSVCVCDVVPAGGKGRGWTGWREERERSREKDGEAALKEVGGGGKGYTDRTRDSRRSSRASAARGIRCTRRPLTLSIKFYSFYSFCF